MKFEIYSREEGGDVVVIRCDDIELELELTGEEAANLGHAVACAGYDAMPEETVIGLNEPEPSYHESVEVS